MVACCWHRLPTSVNFFAGTLTILSYFSTFVLSTPTITYPINSQLPPVARISEPFSFVFSPQTVKARVPVNYAIVRAPPWVSLTSDKRLLSGTPPSDLVPPGLVVGIPITIKATDATGVVQMNATLVVARIPAPMISIPLSEQIEDLGPFSAPDTLLLYEQKDFSFSFSNQTFRNTGQWDLTYYAVNGDNTPLPSWVRFDSKTLTFSGKAPTFSLPTQPPQRFNFKLIASDVVGFSALSIPFSIVVSNHRLTSEHPIFQLNATRGKLFEYNDFLSQLKLDDRTLDLAEVKSVTPTGLPKWLTFDNLTWRLSGTPSPNATATNFSITVVDTYTDTLNVTFQLRVGDTMFNSELPPLKLTAGADFDYQLRPYLADPADTELSIQSNSDISWIRVDQEALSISGTAPSSVNARVGGPLEVSIVATSKRTQASQSQDLAVSVEDLGTGSPSSITSTGSSLPSPSSPGQQTGTPAPASSPTEQPKTYLWLLLPILLIIFFGAIILFYWFRRRHLRKHHRILKSEVSAPLPGTWMHHGAGGNNFGGGEES
ncbi:uncharacterized protein B0I36DRAFT_248631, partial [Microdochium trichocladiopsis]